jgi:acyl carrier protein
MAEAELNIIKIIKKVLMPSEDGPESLLSKENANWDSLKQLQITLELEDFFGIELSDEEAFEFYDVPSILNLVERIRMNGR